MGSLWLDLRHTVRGLRGSLTFTAVTIVVLAIGIGANAAMFSLVRGVLIKPLPFDDPDRLVWLTESVPAMNMPVFPFNAPDLGDLKQFSKTLDEVGAFQSREMELSDLEHPETVLASRVTANLFPMLGFEAALGRTFASEEDVPRSGVVLLSYSLWQERFGGSAEVLGERIELDRQPHTVIGVMPRMGSFPLRKMPLHGQPADLFVPMGFTEVELANRGMMHNLGVIGRLAEGATFASSSGEMAGIGDRIFANYPGGMQSSEAVLIVEMSRLRDVVVGQVERPLLLLLGAMVLVMLVVCANVANLTLSRSLARRGEMAMRAALGATRGRLFRIYLLESLLLVLAGGTLGLGLAVGTLKASQLALHKALPMADRVTMDPTVVLFVAGLSLVVAFLFGWAPLLGSAARGQGVSSASPRGTVARREQVLLRGVAVATMVLAVVLLVGAGLLLRSFGRLLALDPGFQQGGVLTMTVSLPNRAYPEPERVFGFVDALEQSLGTLPGIEAATVTSALPMESRERRAVEAEAPLDPNARHSVSVTWATPLFFETLGIPLRSGRAFASDDRQDSAQVVIVSAPLARQFWGTEEVLGNRIAWQESESGAPVFAEVIGVVGEVNDGPLGSKPLPHLYVPQAQFSPRELVMAQRSDSPWGRNFRVAMLTEGSDPTAFANAAVERIHQLDRSLAVAEIRPLDQILSSSVFSQRFSAGLVTVFALTALLLAAIGLYGVLAYATDQRKREFGVRLALGADGRAVVRMVVSQGLGLSALGLGIGLLAALGLSRFLGSVLYETSSVDPVTLGMVAVVLLTAATLASLLPAWRAGRVDPVSTLRPE